MGGGWSGVCGSLAVPDALVPSVFPVGLWMGPGATPGTRGSEEAWLALSLLWANSEGRPVRGAPLPALPSCMPHTCCPSPLTPAHSGRVRCPSISPRETNVHGMWSLPPLPQRGACGHGGAAEAWVSVVVQGVSAARVWAPLVDWPPRKSGCTLALEAHPGPAPLGDARQPVEGPCGGTGLQPGLGGSREAPRQNLPKLRSDS